MKNRPDEYVLMPRYKWNEKNRLQLADRVRKYSQLRQLQLNALSRIDWKTNLKEWSRLNANISRCSNRMNALIYRITNY